jgi:hypothetical protein
MRRSLLLLSLMTLPVQAGGLYKWVDEKGQMQFSDKPPLPQNVQKGSMEKLDRRGLLIKKIDPVLTPEQMEAEAKQKEQAEQEQEKRRRDNALLKSYTKPDEVDLLRDRALEVIDGEIKSYVVQRKNIENHIAKINERMGFFQQRKKPVPADLMDERRGEEANLERIKQHIQNKEQEKVAVRSKAADDKNRLMELKGLK